MIGSGVQYPPEVEFQNMRDTHKGIDGWLADTAFDVADHLLGETGLFRDGQH